MNVSITFSAGVELVIFKVEFIAAKQVSASSVPLHGEIWISLQYRHQAVRAGASTLDFPARDLCRDSEKDEDD